jgi:hypothetical protein
VTVFIRFSLRHCYSLNLENPSPRDLLHPTTKYTDVINWAIHTEVWQWPDVVCARRTGRSFANREQNDVTQGRKNPTVCLVHGSRLTGRSCLYMLARTCGEITRQAMHPQTACMPWATLRFNTCKSSTVVSYRGSYWSPLFTEYWRILITLVEINF